MRAIAQTTLLSCVLLVLIPLGTARRVVPDIHLVLDRLHVSRDRAIPPKALLPDRAHVSHDRAIAPKSQAIYLLHEDAAGKMSSFWSHPVALAVLLGLLLIGPDQLGSLVTLCALTPGVTSFKVGFSWGLGHSIGMLAICPVFFHLREVSAHNLNNLLAKWEYCGNYFVGISMVVLAVDCLVYESWYRKQIEEIVGELKNSACCCQRRQRRLKYSAPATQFDVAEDSEEEPVGETQFPVQSIKQLETDLIRNFGSQDVQQAVEKTAQSDKMEVSLFCPSLLSKHRHYQAAVVGILQGICCPMAITGILLMNRTSMGSSILTRSIFASAFVLVSSIGAGVMALGWGELSTWMASSHFALPRTVHRLSCVVTFLLGLCSIVVNASGAPHSIDWESKANNLAAGTI